VHTPKRSNRPTVQPKTQASIDDQHSEAILGKLGEKSRLIPDYRFELDQRTVGCCLSTPTENPTGSLHSNVVSRMLTVGRYSKTGSPVMPILRQLLGAECCAAELGSTYPGEK
jgi:hypothetical protein